MSVNNLKDLAQKLAVGTVQFGMDYGINGRQKVSYSEVMKILKYAVTVGCTMADTASMYGSEPVVGQYLSENPDDLDVISKVFAQDFDQAQQVITTSIATFTQPLYGYLIHRFDQYRSEPRIYDLMIAQQKSGAVQKIGFSFYHPSELEYILGQNVPFQLVQLPMSLLDRRFEPYLVELKKRGVEIHVRSVFLQGLLFSTVASLPDFFEPAKQSIQTLQTIAADADVPISALCLLWALSHSEVDRVVVGVHTLEQFQELMHSHTYMDQAQELLPAVDSLQISDEKILVPSNWPKK